MMCLQQGLRGGGHRVEGDAIVQSVVVNDMMCSPAALPHTCTDGVGAMGQAGVLSQRHVQPHCTGMDNAASHHHTRAGWTRSSQHSRHDIFQAHAWRRCHQHTHPRCTLRARTLREHTGGRLKRPRLLCEADRDFAAAPLMFLRPKIRLARTLRAAARGWLTQSSLSSAGKPALAGEHAHFEAAPDSRELRAATLRQHAE